jgi:hypothetical protein
MKIPLKSTNQTTLTSNFYVRKPEELEPRRLFIGNQPQDHPIAPSQCRPDQFSYNLFPLLSALSPPLFTPPAMLRTARRPGREGEPGRTLYCSHSSLGLTAHTHQKLKITDVQNIDVYKFQGNMSQQLPCKGKGKGKGKNRHTVTHRRGDQLNLPESKLYQNIASVE